MKKWNKYIPNEWIILAPIITASTIICNNSYGILNEVTYWTGIISFSCLLGILSFRIFIAIRNSIKNE